MRTRKSGCDDGNDSKGVWTGLDASVTQGMLTKANSCEKLFTLSKMFALLQKPCGDQDTKPVPRFMQTETPDYWPEVEQTPEGLRVVAKHEF